MRCAKCDRNMVGEDEEEADVKNADCSERALYRKIIFRDGGMARFVEKYIKLNEDEKVAWVRQEEIHDGMGDVEYTFVVTVYKPISQNEYDKMGEKKRNKYKGQKLYMVEG